MNKLISTSDRIFMAVVGPSGCGKTNLIYRIKAGNNSYPKFKSVIFVYHEMQPIYSQIEQHSNIVFKKLTNLEFLQNTKNCLLIFDDSCQEIFNDKEFVKLAIAGRHKSINVIYVKHNLYQQSKWSRTIDLKTTHIILFKSPRDVQQVEFLGKQLNLTLFLKNWYKIATRETFGHLLIDLDSKTSDCLRFCSNITKPRPSVFYIPSYKADITKISNEREKILYTKANGTFI